MLIVNADDWGRSKAETDAALRCYAKGGISSISAMVFMEDSERAAMLAKDCGVDVGLHLNLTQPFTGNHHSQPASAEQNRIGRFLRRGKHALLFYNPFLRESFHRVYQAQTEEFERLYGRRPSHVDGHQHMHLCANMVWDRVIPPGERVRRNFTFWPGEKGILNRTYRRVVDSRLARRYRLTQHFFCLTQCLKTGGLGRVAELAKVATVELMSHPIRAQEYEFLAEGGGFAELRDVSIGTYTLV